MSVDDLKKLFPINRIIIAETLGLLCKVIGSYYIIAVILYELARVLQLIYLIGGIFVFVEFLVKIYCFCGIVIGCYQYISKNCYSQIACINVDELNKFINNKLYRTIIIVVAIVLCFRMVFHKENQPESQQQTDKTIQIDDAQNSDMLWHKTEEAAQDEIKETLQDKLEETLQNEIEEDVETELIMYQNQLDLFEHVKGFWRGEDIQYTFSRVNDSYYFINSDSLGDSLTNEKFYIAYYTVVAYEESGNEVKAVISDQNDRKYDLELSVDSNGERMLKMKRQNHDEWIVLTDNTYFSYQELLDSGEYKALWMLREYYSYNTNEVVPHIGWLSIEADNTYCFMDVTEQYEGEEMIIGDSGYQECNYTVLGIRDGFVQPLYEEYSYLNLECYDAENKILWTFYFGGTSGGSCYTRKIYDKENDGWMSEDSDDVSPDCVSFSMEKISK